MVKKKESDEELVRSQSNEALGQVVEMLARDITCFVPEFRQAALAEVARRLTFDPVSG